MKFEIVKPEILNKEGIKKENVKIPIRSTANSAGYDFYSPVNRKIYMNETVIIPTGIKVKLDQDKFLQIHIRSSIGIKKNIVLANCTGIIDADFYENESNDGIISIALKNLNPEPFDVNINDKLVQGIILSYYITKEDSATGNRSGGIGSTD